MNYFGLDVGNANVRLVELEKKDGAGLVVKNLGEAKTPASNWRAAGSKGLESSVAVVRQLMTDLKIKTKNVVINLPEDEVISRLVKLPPLKENEIQDALLFESETFVPYPLEQASLNYEIISKDDQGRPLVFVVAVKHTVVEVFVKLAKALGLSPVAFETSALALRNLFSFMLDLTKPIIVLNIGEQFADLVILKDASVYTTRSISMGGEAFSRAISLSLGLDMPSAEEYKKAYGMREDQLEGKIKAAVLPVFTQVAEEARKAIVSFAQDFNLEIGQLYLTGGGGNMPGLAEGLTKALGIEVLVVDPMTKLDVSGAVSNIEIKNAGPSFGVVTGLALREYL